MHTSKYYHNTTNDNTPNNNNHKDLIYKITSFNVVNHYTLIKFVIAYDLYKIFIDY